jgi:hypothetical protein
MFWPNVVRHNVENYFHALLMRCGYEILIIPQVSEVRLDRVQIYSAVSVVILARAILDDWR